MSKAAWTSSQLAPAAILDYANYLLQTSEQQNVGPSGGKSIDAAGAGKSSISPAWLTQLNMLWSGKGQAKQATLPEIKTSGVGSSGKAVVVHRLMVQMILAQPPNLVSGQLHSLPHLDGFSIVALVMSSVLFTKACCKALSRHALYKWMTETGPVYLLPTGPVSSFLHDLRCYTGCDIVDLKEIFFSACITAAAGFARVISDPAAAKHVLRASDNPQSITAYLWHSALWASLVAAKEACWHYLPTLMPKDLINAAAYLWHSAPWASLFAATEACWHYLPTVLPKNFIDAAAS
eukprot:scaffold198942_cov19-Tisochrysis_lutea.AAC.3